MRRVQEQDMWRPIGAAVAGIVDRLEEQHRRAFARECHQDGVDLPRAPVVASGEQAHRAAE